MTENPTKEKSVIVFTNYRLKNYWDVGRTTSGFLQSDFYRYLSNGYWFAAMLYRNLSDEKNRESVTNREYYQTIKCWILGNPFTEIDMYLNLSVCMYIMYIHCLGNNTESYLCMSNTIGIWIQLNGFETFFGSFLWLRFSLHGSWSQDEVTRKKKYKWFWYV